MLKTIVELMHTDQEQRNSKYTKATVPSKRVYVPDPGVE